MCRLKEDIPSFLFVVLFAFPALSVQASAQSGQPSVPYVVAGVDCSDEEHVKSLLDHAAITAGAEKSLIIIARPGTGENSSSLIRRRLSAPQNYLVETRGVSKGKVITAVGERVRGPGHVEVYVGGDLFIIFKMKRKRHFASGGCSPVG